MNGTPRQALKEKFEGKGWENSISVGSLDELREQLQSLDAILSSEDDSYGFQDFHSNIQVRFLDSDTPIDSFSVDTGESQKSSFHGWGEYRYNSIEGYSGTPLVADISFNNYPGFFNTLSSYRDSDLSNTYLTFDLSHANAQLSNGAPLNTFNDGIDNPELVLELNEDFWSDLKLEYNAIEEQKGLAESLNFEIIGDNIDIDFSSIKTADDPETALANIIQELRFTVKTDQDWTLPFYAENIHADVYFSRNHVDDSDDNYWFGNSLRLYLADHDSTFSPNSGAANYQKGAVETSESGEGTVFEFGVANGWQLSNMLRDVQENYNFYPEATQSYKLEGINLHLNQILDGSSYNLHLNANDPDTAGKITGNKDLMLTTSPYNNYISDFSEEGFPQIETSGDFASVIDAWALGDEGPQLELKNGLNGLSKYQHSSLNLQFESIGDENPYYMSINAQSMNGLSGELYVHSVFDEYLGDIVDYKLKRIHFHGNEWNIRENPDDTHTGSHTNVTYEIDSDGEITAINSGSGDGTYIPSIQELIPNVEALKTLSLTGQNDLSYFNELQAAVELGFDGQSFDWNKNAILPPPPGDAAFKTYYSLEDLDQLAILGDSVDFSAKYNLEITAEMLNNFSLEGADITIKFDQDHFIDVTESDITIGSALPIANAVKVDNEAGTIRISASSLSEFANGGSGINAVAGLDPAEVLANISFDFDEVALAGIAKNSDGSLATNPLSFGISANIDETVLSRFYDDSTGFDNQEISTLRELNQGIIVEGKDVTLYEAKINLEQLDDGLVLRTDRAIGADASSTNLVRSGDTLTTSVKWRNTGNIAAHNLQVSEVDNDNASLVGSYLSTNSVNSGSFQNGVFVEAGREDVTLTADIHINGEAGNVVSLSEGILSLQADGSEIFSNAGVGSSNLITFQGDLNYDGRVSMKDLAYLNAGAARQIDVVQGSDGDLDANGTLDASVARDVDADFNGKIDIGDLAILDNDWGKTLHTGDEAFQGSTEISWDQLDSQGNSSTWDNASFKNQNAVEADPGYIGSLESPTSTGVIGADGNSVPNDGGIQGTEFQDPLAA